jgi:hypothetical protein
MWAALLKRGTPQELLQVSAFEGRRDQWNAGLISPAE